MFLDRYLASAEFSVLEGTRILLSDGPAAVDRRAAVAAPLAAAEAPAGVARSTADEPP